MDVTSHIVFHCNDVLESPTAGKGRATTSSFTILLWRRDYPLPVSSLHLKSPFEASSADNRERYHSELGGLQVWPASAFPVLLLFQRCWVSTASMQVSGIFSCWLQGRTQCNTIKQGKFFMWKYHEWDPETKLLPKARRCCLYFQNKLAFLSVTLVQWTLPWLQITAFYFSHSNSLLDTGFPWRVYALILLSVWCGFTPTVPETCSLAQAYLSLPLDVHTFLGGLTLPPYWYSCRSFASLC